jgi:hypothetical protein
VCRRRLRRRKDGRGVGRGCSSPVVLVSLALLCNVKVARKVYIKRTTSPVLPASTAIAIVALWQSGGFTVCRYK